jgi:hypothetical protein
MSRKGGKKKSKSRKTYHVRGFCRNLALAYRFLGAEGFEDCDELDMALREAFYTAKKERIRTGCHIITLEIFKSALYDCDLIKPSPGNVSFLRVLLNENDAMELLQRHTNIRRDINGFLNAARVLREFYHNPELHFEYQKYREQWKK